MMRNQIADILDDLDAKVVQSSVRSVKEVFVINCYNLED